MRFANRCSFATTLIVLIPFFGCEHPTSKNVGVPSLKNNLVPRSVDDVGAGFEKLSENLFAKPLAKPSTAPAPSKSKGGMSYENVTQCGIDFTNFLSRNITNKFLETGSGIALGDYDNDGLVDIYFTGSDVANRLYKNLGNFQFEDVTETAGVDGRINGHLIRCSSASFADIDNDGDLDLYLCNMTAPNVLFINQNDGTFDEQTKLRGAGYSGASKQASFCDYDRDGDLDFYLLTYQDDDLVKGKSYFQTIDGQDRVVPGSEDDVEVLRGHRILAGESDFIFQNQGDGTFVKLKEEVGIKGHDFGLGCIWFDYNNDGWQDIYVGSDFKQPDRLYKNNQDGTFTDVLPQVASRTTWFSMGMDSGDLNNDGLLDLFVADMASQNHYDQKVNMGSMGDAAWFLKSGEPRQFMKNCVFINAGTNRFLETATMTGMAKSSWTWSVRLVDMNNDGRQDVFITNGHARDSMNSDIVAKLKKIRAEGIPNDPRSNEIHRSIPIRKDTNLAFANLGGLEFQPTEKEWGLNHHGVSHAAGFADLDLDGDLDCIVNNYYEPALTYRNQSPDGARLLVELRCRDNNFFGIGSKVEVWQNKSYQRRDLIPSRGYLSSDPMVLHFGFSNSQIIERMKITWPDGTSTELSNIEPNHFYRVIEPELRVKEFPKPSSTLFVDQTQQAMFDFQHQESDFDDFAKEPLLPFQLSRLGGSIANGDINGDGLVDVYCGGAAGQSGKLFVNRGDTYELLAGPWENAVQSEDMGALFFDADGDGKTDLYVASGGNEFAIDSPNYKDRLYRNMGDLEFTDISDTALPNIFASSSSVASVDFDRDGDLDLFVGSRSVPGKYPLTPESHLLINDAGVFRVASAEISGGVEEVGLVNSAIWSDYDSDGWPDLLVAIEWGPISVFKNNEGKLVNVTDSVGLSEQLGWWHGIAAGDLDADGDIDYVVTNQGLNTKYHASVEHPHRLYYDDFDQSGSLDLVEAEFEGDVEYPVRGRSCSSRCMPFVAEKFKTFHDYSLASISDIYQTDKEERPFREVNRLESSIIWNEGITDFEWNRCRDLHKSVLDTALRSLTSMAIHISIF